MHVLLLSVVVLCCCLAQPSLLAAAMSVLLSAHVGPQQGVEDLGTLSLLSVTLCNNNPRCVCQEGQTPPSSQDVKPMGQGPMALLGWEGAQMDCYLLLFIILAQSPACDYRLLGVPQ